MSFRFRKSVRIIPGVRLNLSGSGVSVSLGGPGATLNISARGSAVTLGLPGTGLSYRHRLASRSNTRAPGFDLFEPEPASPPAPSAPREPCARPSRTGVPLVGEIRSAEVAALTSPDLRGLKRLIDEAVGQKAFLAIDLRSALADREAAWRALRRAEQFPLRLVQKRRIPQHRAAFEEAEGEALKVLEAAALSELRVEFAFDERTAAAQRELEAAHTRLSRCARIWDVTSRNSIDRTRERSVASSALTRTPVRLSTVADTIIAGRQAGLRFQNANGADLDFFPGFLLMRQRGAGDYALVDLRDVTLDVQATRFLEEEGVPSDATVVGQAWARSNRDGSPDRRFADNHQIPIVTYGQLAFATSAGVSEVYHVSDPEAAHAFAAAFHGLQAALRGQSGRPSAVAPAPPSEPRSIDLDAQLPALPNVPAAHGYTVGAAALAVALSVAAVAVGARVSAPPPAVAGTPVDSAGTVAGPAVPMSPAAPREPAAPRSLPTPGPIDPAPLTRAAIPVAARERATTRQRGNVRVGPDRSAAVVRVAEAGATVVVFGRQRDWVQVGDDQPWGWMHTSLLAAP